MAADAQDRLADTQGIVDIRGQGMMLAIELNKPCAELVSQALEQGLLINVTAGNTVRLLPPIILTESEAIALLDKLCPLIQDFLS